MSLQDTQKIKQLNTRKVKLDAEIERLADESREANKALDTAKNRRAAICEEIASLKDANSADPTVTEHAVLRYLERAKGVDISAIRSDILNPNVLASVRALGNGKHPIGNGMRAIVKDNTVVSVA